MVVNSIKGTSRTSHAGLQEGREQSTGKPNFLWGCRFVKCSHSQGRSIEGFTLPSHETRSRLCTEWPCDPKEEGDLCYTALDIRQGPRRPQTTRRTRTSDVIIYSAVKTSGVSQWAQCTSSIQHVCWRMTDCFPKGFQFFWSLIRDVLGQNKLTHLWIQYSNELI